MKTPQPETNTRVTRRKRILRWSLSALAVVLIAVGAFVWWFFRGDAPDAVSIGDAAAQVQEADVQATEVVATAEASAAEATNEPAADAAATESIAGSWSVDTSVGEFNYEDSTGTFVGFRVDEELSGIGSTTAVGRTPEITGTLVIEGTTVTAVTIEADMTAITTNESRRDDKVQSALDTAQFPTATFVLTEPIELGDAAASGETVSVMATGELTIHGVTTSVTIPLEAQVVGDNVVVVGSLDIVFADYGVSVPSAPVVVSAEEAGVIELQLFFSQA
jgi:polyisoprenoid-binding protein YceI